MEKNAPQIPACASDTAEAQARRYFPRGLIQPAGSFRFSVDALLLAEFAAGSLKRPVRGLDLGCGCGVVGLGILLRLPNAQFVGLDIDPELTAAAAQNAALLGLSGQYQAVTADIRDCESLTELPPGGFDLVVANPPYRKANSGRLPPTELRTAALFETRGGLDAFVAVAARALKNGGRFCCIYSAERLPELCAALAARQLTPKRICPVHGRAGDAALLVLMEARRNGRPGLKWEPAIYLAEN